MDLLMGLANIAAIVVHDDWDLSEKGKKDAERHHEKIDDAIRKNVKDVIAEESIITKKKGRKVRIPVKGLKDYRFIHGNNEGDVGGVGQGDGKAGDVIDSQQKPGQGQDPGKPGEKDRGHDIMEVEIDLDYLIDIMFQDLGLPYIEEKTKKQKLVPKGWKFETISKKGIRPRLHKKKTMMEAIKRMVAYAFEITRQTGCTTDDANRALRQATGDMMEAIAIIKEDRLTETECSIIFDEDDLRYKQIEPDVEIQSQAVVICMMDVSGSMTQDKKYLARSMLFWLVEFLKKMYDNVDIKFIVHTTEAWFVDEDTFFHKMESGGTQCHTAIDKANYLIDTEYPMDEWNVYCVYISDGEDWDTKKTITSIGTMLKKNINMLSYVEINPTYGGNDDAAAIYANFGGYGTLLNDIRKQWDFKHTKDAGTDFYMNETHRFLLGVIKSREHVFPALRHMLFSKQ